MGARWPVRAIGGVVVAGVLAGCAGARSEAGGYVVRAKGFRVTAPPGWERIPSDADLALRQPGLEAGLMAHATCEGRPPIRPLPVLVRHLRFGLTEVRDLAESPVRLAGQPAVKSRFYARLDGRLVVVDAVTVRGPACVYDLVGVAPPDRWAAVAPAFQRFTESFALLEGER